jgi:hypothetical protein
MGARYYITTERAEAYRELISRPAWRRISPDADFYQVFELADVRAPGHFLGEGRVRNIEWRPERRVFEVDAQSDGAFVLVESFHPGWRARIDGVPVGCSRYAKAFLQIPVRAGRHRIEFEFRSRGLRLGAGISLLSLVALAGLLFWPAARRRPAAS